MIIFKLISVVIRLGLELCILSGLIVASKMYFTSDISSAEDQVGAIWGVAHEQLIKPSVSAACGWTQETSNNG